MVRASLHSVAETPVDENAGYPGPVPQTQLAENLEQHIESTLKIHHDEPADPSIDPTLAECIRIPLGRDDVYADLYIRECDGTACVIYSGEVVVTIDDELSRHSAISAAVHAFYQYLMETGEQSKKILAGRLNAYIANTIDDPTKIVPAGKSCEWPMVEVVAPDIDAITKELQEWPGEEPEGLPSGELHTTASDLLATDEDDLLGEPPAGDAAVEIVAIAEGEAASAEACGEEGVVEAVLGPTADDYLARTLAETRYEESLARAKDLYVQASQHRARLQANVKAAKDEEAERLDEIDLIESRGWQYFLPSKAKPAAAANETPAPSIPSHESTLPPPEAPLSPQAGVSEANDSPAPPAGDWQSVDIAALNLPKSLTTKLREAGHDTIGKLEALRGTFEGLLSIAGVGRTKADAIEEALLGWLTKNRDSKEINEVREKNRAAMVAGESVALEMAAQGQ